MFIPVSRSVKPISVGSRAGYHSGGRKLKSASPAAASDVVIVST